MRLRQLISLSALAVVAYRSYGKLRKAKSMGPGPQGAFPTPRRQWSEASGFGTGVRPAGQSGTHAGNLTDRPAVERAESSLDEIR